MTPKKENQEGPYLSKGGTVDTPLNPGSAEGPEEGKEHRLRTYTHGLRSRGGGRTPPPRQPGFDGPSHPRLCPTPGRDRDGAVDESGSTERWHRREEGGPVSRRLRVREPKADGSQRQTHLPPPSSHRPLVARHPSTPALVHGLAR